MIKILIEYVKLFLRYKHPFELLYRAVVLLMVSTWLVVIYLAVFHFPTVIKYFESKNNNSAFLFEQTAAANSHIDIMLNEITYKNNIERIYVERFHDNLTDFMGLHFIYTTRTNELDLVGISNEIVNNQSVPMVVYPKMIQSFIAGKCWSTSTTNNYSIFSSRGIKSVVRCPMLDKLSNKIIGMIGIESITHQLNKKQLAAYEEVLTRASKTIVGILYYQIELKKRL